MSAALIELSLVQFGRKLRPIDFGFQQPLLRVRLKVRSKVLAIAKIEFAIDDPPRFGVDIDRNPFKCHFACAVAAELWRIFDRLADE